MGKWLAIGAGILLVLMLLLWREMRPTEAKPVAIKPPPPRHESYIEHPAPAPAPGEGSGSGSATEPVSTTQPGKIDVRSDEFFYKFDAAIPKVLTRNAAKCYEGKHGQLHRNQKLSLRYKVGVMNGEIHVTDVTIKESTLNDAALEACFIEQVQHSTWKDDQLPDVQMDDELVLRPERGMKKFWKDNMDYVGAEAPKD
ncbi:MAG TPA: hypothetical protein VH165_31060 [Kofleriaceae bacterium]|jgi:hypothetical protein|nr:hypothetical protein [Kofleriaceae bacterium]